jgi:CRISPR-associated protein Cas1
MDAFTPAEMKTILHSKRANLYYLEHCRVLMNQGRVEYVTDEGRRSAYWNIPIANTNCLLLGSGTSVTQAAMRELAKAGVMLGFCGGGGTPLFAATERSIEAAWLQPQSEYRPTQYLQAWVSFWFDDAKRLRAAKALQSARIERIRQEWLGSKQLRQKGFEVGSQGLQAMLDDSLGSIERAGDTNGLLLEEAALTKKLFKLAARAVNYGDFSRAKRGGGLDPANRFLDHGNYLAYGLGATACWVLGLPHGLAVLHGKTRRGGLVFDAADLIKDAAILPRAFISAMGGDSETEFRQSCVEGLTRSRSLDFIFETLEGIALRVGRPGA